MTITAASLADAMQNSGVVNYETMLPAVNDALLQAGCTNVNRAAMFLAQIGEESGGLRYMEEVASGAEYEGRADLGNTQPGDGVRYKGRGPLQITGRDHYATLSRWAFSKGLVATATYFVDNPTQLALVKYGFLGACWYWTVARPQLNTLSDNKDIVGATKAVNGGDHGLADRTQRWNHCLTMGDAILPNLDGVPVMPRPDFNEYPLWSPNCGPRNGTPIDLWLWHTEEGDIGDPNAADNLARNDLDKASSQVSYHYTGSQGSDGGVTICDVVDTDQESWSVLSANPRSIDFCIAGSTVNWTRDQWLKNSNVIDVGCYLSVLDCIKYPTLVVKGQPPRVIAPDPSNTNVYHFDPPGISDHKYVTQYLHDGSHSDMGPNFPWDYVEQRTTFWWTALTGTPVTPPPAPTPPPVPVPVPVPAPPFIYPSDHDMLVQVWEQLFGYQGKGFPALFGMTADGKRGKYPVEALGDVHAAEVPAAVKLAAKMSKPVKNPRKNV